MMDKEQRTKVIDKLYELEQILIMNNPQRTPSTISDEVTDEALLVFLGIVVGQVSNVMSIHPAFTHRLLSELDIAVTKEKEKEPNTQRGKGRAEKLD